MTADTTPREVLEAYREFQGIHHNKWTDLEAELNAVGYEFLSSGRVDEAIEIFKLNVQEYPERYNPYDSLAEAYAAKGMQAEAIELYRRSFLMGRLNRNALTRLERLGWRAAQEQAPRR